jgi:hypothetical protein
MASRRLTDHSEIRQWAQARNATPACVRGTGGGEETGMIRLDFPGFSGVDRLQDISWDEWFQSFEDNKLALLVQEETAGGAQSNFNKLVSRETAAGQPASRAGRGTGGRSRAGAGGSGSRRAARGSRKATGGARKTGASRGGSRKASARSRKAAGGSRKRAGSSRGGAKRR